jgi:hypothetical protein
LDVDFDEDMSDIKALSETERRVLKPFVKNDANKDETWFAVFGKFVVPAGEYKTPIELARRVTKEFSMVFNIPRYQYRSGTSWDWWQISLHCREQVGNASQGSQSTTSITQAR